MPVAPGPEPGPSPFARWCRELLDEEFAASPVLASALGLSEHDARLDDLSAAAFTERRRRAVAWRERLAALPDAALAPAERIDRDLLIATLAGRTILAEREPWRRQPEIYVGLPLQGVFTLFLHRLRPAPELVRAAMARLRAVPEALARGRENLVPELVAPVLLDRAERQARAGARYLAELLPAEVDEPALRAALGEAGAAAGAALQEFAGFLAGLRERASGDFALGAERYGRLLRERELLPLDAAALHRRGQAEYDRLAAELRELARRVSGTDDWAAVLRDLDRDHPATPEAMRAAYAHWTERARRFLRERALVTLPEGEECRVEPSPAFQRPLLAVASYAGPPPFAPGRRGHFFVPFPPDGVSADEVRQRLEDNSHAAIPTTAVHEAYPGHHWHLVTAKAHPSAIRRTFRSGYFTEGWALYAEHLMREQGFFEDPRQELCQAKAMLFRAARIVVDTSLHAGEMTLAEAARVMMERTDLTAPVARAEVARYAAWPTQASGYLVGCLEILAMRARVLAASTAGPAALRDFHDRLAGSGALPLPLAERALATER